MTHKLDAVVIFVLVCLTLTPPLAVWARRQLFRERIRWLVRQSVRSYVRQMEAVVESLRQLGEALNQHRDDLVKIAEAFKAYRVRGERQ